jgi:cation diffusion facilitator CzcD-associated flavoprotein CzcO
MGVGLRRLGIERFTIFEQSQGMGGTWYDNHYPGAEVDTSVPFYSFSFSPFDFTRNYVSQAELLAYLEHTADRFHLREQFRFGSRVTRAEWQEETHSYEVFTEEGSQGDFEVVVSAVGLLNHPKFPDWPGLDKFRGPKFHSARWDEEVDLTGKRVAVVGTGSTSAQVVPAIAPIADQLYVFQRQPGWVVPKGERDFTAMERAKLLNPMYRRWMRARQYILYERYRGIADEGTKNNLASQAACQRYLDSALADRPDLQKVMTPDYPFAGKRPIKDSNFYPALLRENVELIPNAVASITETEVVDEIGTAREVDVLVMCTGFQPASFLATLEVVGVGGRTIHEAWGDYPRAYLGLMVPGFPNFYMLYGPNTNGAPVMFMHERQANFVVGQVKRMLKGQATAIEVRESVYNKFNEILAKRLSHSVSQMHPEVHSYSNSPSGNNVLSWHDGMSIYWLLTRGTRRLATVTRKLKT